MSSVSLAVAAGLSFLLVVLHVFIIAAGAPAYRYFAAGESMVRPAEQGSPIPGLVTHRGGLHAPRPLLVAQAAQRGPAGPPTRERMFSAVSLSIGLVYIAAIAAVWSSPGP